MTMCAQLECGLASVRKHIAGKLQQLGSWKWEVRAYLNAYSSLPEERMGPRSTARVFPCQEGLWSGWADYFLTWTKEGGN